MPNLIVGFLHPGAMGVSLAASAVNSGCTALWASEGRSAQTRARAEAHGLKEVSTLADLCGAAEIAATFESAGVPGGFHQAAGEIYRRIGGFKDASERPELEAVLSALLKRA